MKEFILFVRTEGDPLKTKSPDELQKHFQKIFAYIDNLKQQGKLLGSNPLEMEGKMISGKKGAMKDGPFNESKEVIGGFFHIKARDLDEAVEIAMANPIFEEGYGKIEVRPVKSLK